jgi:hypothetical protein
MRTKLPDQIKSLVIQQWLQGISRDAIVTNNGLSSVAVTSIVSESRQALGSTTAVELRESATNLKRVALSPAQCAVGVRVAMAMVKLGVKEDDFESFMSDVYHRCTDLGLMAENIASHLIDLIEISKSVPVSRISDYINEKKNEKDKLEKDIDKLKDEKLKLLAEKAELEARCDSALYAQRLLMH